MAIPRQINKVASTAHDLLKYFEDHPYAFETTEQMAQWWLEHQPYENSLEIVQQALDYLESLGEVSKTSVQGGRMIYRKTT